MAHYVDPASAVVTPVEDGNSKPLTPMEVDEIIPVTDGEFDAVDWQRIYCERFTDLKNHPDVTCEEGAFGLKHLADLGQDEDDFRVFHWDVGNWSKLDKRITSPIFECGGHKW